MTTPHDPQGTDREDELLRAVLAEEDAAEEVEHGRRDPISPVARDRLRSGTAAAPAPQERPSGDDVYGAVDRVRAVPEASAPGAAIGDAGDVPERTPAPTTRPAPTPASPDETSVPVARPAASESAPATAAPAPAASPESEPLAPAAAEPAPAERRTRATLRLEQEDEETPSALAEGLARTGPDTATIRQVEAASPWTRLHSPQDDDVAPLVPTGPRPGAGEEDDPAAPPATDAAVPTDDPAGHGARRRTALLLGALVLLALIAVVLAIVLN
ncbi:hypothetical protein [Micrococcus sp.]|uniref:hypothetical protein n=1 Tax=Micrococcus sp. TaxID=1271 RepID=UPI0026DC7606|nr:hypothetical protein [Micrococcus sp.]MDO4239538.1 hypothetical protein [Micrococcus sp.]